jgi:hypothetical protein
MKMDGMVGEGQIGLLRDDDDDDDDDFLTSGLVHVSRDHQPIDSGLPQW